MRARRLPVIDEYVEDGESVVLLGGRVLTLSVVATAALAALGARPAAAGEWVSLHDVARALAAAVGEPPDRPLADKTADTLTALADLGLVEVRG